MIMPFAEPIATVPFRPIVRVQHVPYSLTREAERETDMAESKLATIKGTAATASRDAKATAKGAIPAAPASSSSLTPKQRMSIWDLAPDEVSATVLAELRL